MQRILILIFLYLFNLSLNARDHHGIVYSDLSDLRFPLIMNSIPTSLLIDENEDRGIQIAVGNLQSDFQRVSGNKAVVNFKPGSNKAIIIGSLHSKYIKTLIEQDKIEFSKLSGKTEKYIITTVSNPLNGIEEALVIAGSDKRGTIYGIYELSEQIGVSPWYDWADVPVRKSNNLSIAKGEFTAGEPAVRYRGLFLNDEAPCLTTWVKNTYDTDYGDHRFYARVFELILRLRGNFMWPAMWCWSFYHDDPRNITTANDMGVIMGTSHHEPMARNHQEWARNRAQYGAWNYKKNQSVIDNFFKDGIDRIKHTEDIITIGMRGDGDEAMSDETDIQLMERIIANQREIISEVTKCKASETPQVWALYKEVLDYYDAGLRVPDDVTMLLCDDNWGNVRRLPNEQERKHPGGWGMYYHVDYVGAPRNSKWINSTPIQNMWEQLRLTYDYGVDRLWILNVGDLKPMEYPISLFMDMAWNPVKYNAENLSDHTEDFCNDAFGYQHGKEAARILNLSCKYNGRVTAEMLDRNTYNLESGEWKSVSDEFCKLEAEALRQYISINPEFQDAYKQLILFPVQAMSNLYEMYYSQAMNHKLFKIGDPEANVWADKVVAAFKRDSILCAGYNHNIADGKWNGMMIQKHIGYESWNDNFPADVLPQIFRMDPGCNKAGGYVHKANEGVVVIEAPHYYECADASESNWTHIPHIGRTMGGMSMMPYTGSTSGGYISYKFKLPERVDSVNVYVVVKSTLAFKRSQGHRYSISFDKCAGKEVNFNENLNEKPQYIYDVFYPTVARRVVENTVSFDITPSMDGYHTLRLSPIEPGTVFEKVIIDFGGYKKSYLYMNESPYARISDNE